MNCPNCGKEIDENKKFCPKCGFDLRKNNLFSTKNLIIASAISVILLVLIFAFLFPILFILDGATQLSL